jgi:hypothetical protein
MIGFGLEGLQQHHADLAGIGQVVRVTADTTLSIEDGIVLIDMANASANVTVTLPCASKCPGKHIDIILLSVDRQYTLDVVCPGMVEQTFDEDILVTAGDCLTVHSNAASWELDAILFTTLMTYIDSLYG